MIQTVDLVQVDVVHAKPGQAGVDLREDRLARQPAPVRARAHGMANLRGDDGFVTVREILQGAPEDFLAGALRVGVCRVEELMPASIAWRIRGLLSSSGSVQVG